MPPRAAASRKVLSACTILSMTTNHSAVIPICYVFDGEHFYSPLDEKPKRVAPRQLKRVRNIEAKPHVALVIDDYADDWSKLAYVLATGLATIIQPGSDEHARAVQMLRAKYALCRPCRKL